MKILYKYEGPVLDGNNKVRNRSYIAYTHATSKKQALQFLKRQYQKEYGLSERAFIILKENYLLTCD